MTLKDQIKTAVRERRRERHPFEFFGATVFIRELTAAAKDAFDQSLITVVDGKREQDLANFRARFLAACLEDDGGALIFTDEGDEDWLGAQPSTDIDPAFKECQRVNGIGEDARKNSAGTPGSSSTTS